MALTGAGGVLGMQYQHPFAGERHALHVHIAHFDPTPVATAYGVNDRLYISGGPVTPSESSVLQTFAAVAALWAPYYGPTWQLLATELQQIVGDNLTELAPGVGPPPVVGTDPADDDSGVRAMYVFRLLGKSGVKRRLMLLQVRAPTMPMGEFEVAPSGGGLDVRDQHWMAYLSGSSGGGVVMPDGDYCFPVTDMALERSRHLQLTSWVLPGAPYVVTG